MVASSTAGQRERERAGIALALREHSLLKNRTKRMLLGRASVTSTRVSGQKWATGQCGYRQWQECATHMQGKLVC